MKIKAEIDGPAVEAKECVYTEILSGYINWLADQSGENLDVLRSEICRSTEPETVLATLEPIFLNSSLRAA